MKSRRGRWNPNAPRRKSRRNLRKVLRRLEDERRRQYDKRATPYAPKEPTQFARVVNGWLRLENNPDAQFPSLPFPLSDFDPAKTSQRPRNPSRCYQHSVTSLPPLCTIYLQSYSRKAMWERWTLERHKTLPSFLSLSVLLISITDV